MIHLIQVCHAQISGWLLSIQSDYTTASLCISDDCFLCAHVAPDPIETSRNLPYCTFSSFEGALDLSWEVQHVKDIDWSPPGIVVSVSSKEIWNRGSLCL